MSAATSLGVRPPATTSPTSGTEILPSGRTGTVMPSSGLRRAGTGPSAAPAVRGSWPGVGAGGGGGGGGGGRGGGAGGGDGNGRAGTGGGVRRGGSPGCVSDTKTNAGTP